MTRLKPRLTGSTLSKPNKIQLPRVETTGRPNSRLPFQLRSAFLPLVVLTLPLSAHAQDFVADFDVSDEFSVLDEIEASLEEYRKTKKEDEDSLPTFVGEDEILVTRGTKMRTNFWDVKTLKLTSNTGIAVNPNKLANQQGKTDFYFNPILFGLLSRGIDDSDDNSETSTNVSLSGLLYSKEHFDNIGSDVDVSGVYGSVSRKFNRCWTFSATPGIEVITRDQYGDWLSTDIPLKAQITRKFYDAGSCKDEGGTADSQASFRYVKTFVNPSTRDRDEYRFTYSKTVMLTEKWSMTIAPTLKHTVYTNLAGDADLDNTDLQLPISFSRKLSKEVSLVLKGEIGIRESTDDTRDSEFADLPLSFSLTKSF